MLRVNGIHSDARTMCRKEKQNKNNNKPRHPTTVYPDETFICPFDLGNVITAACPLIAARRIDRPRCSWSPYPTPLRYASLKPSPKPTLPMAPAPYGNPSLMCITLGTANIFSLSQKGWFRMWHCLSPITGLAPQWPRRTKLVSLWDRSVWVEPCCEAALLEPSQELG